MSAARTEFPKRKLMMVPVGKIKRHPECQRKSQIKKYLNKIERDGDVWSPDKLGVAILSSDGNGGYFAHDRGHGIEQAQKVMGLRWEIPALVYQGVLSKQQASDIFVSHNRGLAVSTGVSHGQYVMAHNPNATFVELQRLRLPRTRTVGAFYTILRTHGRKVLEDTVTLALKVWGEQSEFPGTFIVGLARFVDETKTPADIAAAAKRWQRKKCSTGQWLDRARIRRAQSGGRGTLPDHLRVVLRGR